MLERVGRIDRFVTRKLTAEFGQTGLLSDFLRVLPAHTEALSASSGTGVGSIVGSAGGRIVEARWG